MTGQRKLVRNVAANWTRLGSGMFWGLILTPIFLKTLGASDYGIWLLVNSVVGYYGLLDLGTRAAVVRFASRSIALKDETATNETFNTALVVYTVVGVAALLLSLALGYILPQIPGFAAGQHPQATLLITLIGANVAIALPGKLIEGMLSAIERFDVSNAIGMGFSAARNLIFIAVLVSGANLVTLSLVLLITTVFEQSTVAIVVKRMVPGLRYSPRLARRSQMRGIFSYGIHSVIGQAGERLRLYSDSIVIGAFLPAAAISLFNIGQRPLLYLSKLSLGVSRVLTPAFSRTEALASNPQLANMLVLGTRASTLITSLACLILFLAGPELIHLWVGDGFEESFGVLHALLPAYLLSAGTTPVNSILLGTSRHQRLSQVTVVEGLVNIGLSLWLIQPLGILGVAIGTSIPMLIARLFVLPSYACRNIGLSFRTFLWRGLAPAVPGFLVGGLVGWLAKRQWPEPDLLSVALVVLAATLGYLLATLALLAATRDPLLLRFLDRQSSSAKISKIEVSDPGESETAVHPRFTDPLAAPLRILLVAYRFPPQGGGGVQRPAKLAKFWSRAGHKVTVLTSHTSTSMSEDHSLLDDIPPEVERIVVQDSGIFRRLHHLRDKISSRLGRRVVQVAIFLTSHLVVPDVSAGWRGPAIRRGRALVDEFHPDVVIVTGPPWTPFLVAVALARRAGARLVLDYRDPWMQTYLSVNRGWLSGKIDPWIERQVVARADGIVAAHREILRRIKPLAGPGIRRLWVPNGADPDDFPALPVSLPRDRFVLGYTGGFFRWRTPTTLVRVIEDLLREGKISADRFQFRMAGSVQPVLDDLAPDSPARAVIKIEGYLPHADSIRLLQTSTVNFVLEVDQEGHNYHTPGKFYEVLHVGRPVLLLSPEGLTARLGRCIGGCWFAHPGDAESIRTALLDMYTRWETGASMPEVNAQHLRFYDRSHQADRYARFLFSLVGRPTGTRESRSRVAGA